MTRVALLWHMHQPYYEDLVTREHILPWVRLHALKDYYGMVAMLRDFPAVRMTFNLVPSLLMQIEAFAANRASDRYLVIGSKPAEEIDDADLMFMIGNFFHAQRERMIDTHPRYADLLRRRNALPAGGDATAARRFFGVEEIRDLQVWQKLAWIDPLFVDRDARGVELVAKGEQFTEGDKEVLRAIELELLKAVIPAYREAEARGQIELSTSPLYHPILPLLCDTDINRRTNPSAEVHRPRFAHPEDALAQLAQAAAYHERLFGRRPAGLWPSEGSVSDAMVPLVAQAGFEWMATDELILARTLGETFTRDGNGVLDRPERLYRPYVVTAGGGRVTSVFRDHALSDLIGFVYASWPAEAAADDFVGRLVQAGRRFAERTAGEEALIPVILDGENAWEHFQGGGRPFLRALYRRLSETGEIRTVTMAEACRGATAELTGIFPGSWIDANFDIWIGHRDDRRAWGQLAQAREALDSSRQVDSPAAERAREEIWIAEGSDWFWWYGDDHSSEHDAEFDDLFRRHLRNVHTLLERPVPDDLFVSNISTGLWPRLEAEPTGLITPTLDGEETSYFEWLGAGRFEVREERGTMHRSEAREAVVRAVAFGFDEEQLYVRVDGSRPVLDLLADGYEFALTFLSPGGLRFSVRQALGRLAGVFWHLVAHPPHWVESGAERSALGAGDLLEMAVPLSDLGAPVGEVVFQVTIHGPGGEEVERHPRHRPIRVRIADAEFEARHWTV
jgi:alpha-amylase/alpha-mannosidase (GH57 family)